MPSIFGGKIVLIKFFEVLTGIAFFYCSVRSELHSTRKVKTPILMKFESALHSDLNTDHNHLLHVPKVNSK